MTLARQLRRLVGCTSGTAAIEATLLLPMAISLMAGALEFGQIFSAYGAAEKSVRDAARYLARVPHSAICEWGLTNAQNLAVYGKLDPAKGDSPLIANWRTSNVALQTPDCSAPLPPNITVVELHASVPYSGNLLRVLGMSNSWTLHVRHEERYVGE